EPTGLTCGNDADGSRIGVFLNSQVLDVVCQVDDVVPKAVRLCRKQNRPASPTWVEEMHMRHVVVHGVGGAESLLNVRILHLLANEKIIQLGAGQIQSTNLRSSLGGADVAEIAHRQAAVVDHQ